ncbi:MAG: hypothetical protein NWE80_03775 [Candidatus Bathyarchaeota archaeon]|nr:hypothetical protein [Candidatus Bathyarchaeota archaeon]
MSEILVVIGLIFELLAVVYADRKVFRSKSLKERKTIYIEGLTRTIDQKLESIRRQWYVILGLLFFGMFLQAISLFVVD